ncbi:MAG: Rab family GTPase [Candidatus Hermodarchaeota archaeon]
MLYDKERLEALLKWYRQEVGKDLVAVFVLNREGSIINFLVNPAVKAIEDFVRGLMGLILKRIVEDSTIASFGLGTFDTAKYRFIFCEAGPNHILVTILDGLAMSEPIFPYAYLAAEKVARIFDGRPVSPVIPKIYTDKIGQAIQRKENTLQKIRIAGSNYVYKLILGGDGAVGKTSMVQRFVEGIFRTDYKATIGTSITKKECKFDGLESNVRFTIWDLAGQPQFERIRNSYLVNAEAGLLVYDITRRDTFDNIKKWYDEVKEGAKPNIILILCANKTDLRDTRAISTKEGVKLAEDLGISYIETSALTGENINDTFRMIALQLIKRFLKVDVISKIEDYSPPATETTIEEKVVTKEPDLGDYKVIPVNTIWPDIKKDFNPWLERNIEKINKTLDISLIPIKKGKIFDDIDIDILAQDNYGNKVIIETQYDESNQANLIHILKSLAYNNAKQVIWICENPKKEHIKIINWLNDNSLENIAFYLIKLEVFSIDNTPPAPLFIKISSPDKNVYSK